VEPMNPDNYLLLAAYKGDRYLQLVSPVATGDLLILGWGPDELENVIVLQARSDGHVVELSEPLNRAWPDGTPMVISHPDLKTDF
jgi:hypothetical protein